MKQEKFPHNRKPTHRHISGELLNFRGQPNQTHTHTHTHIQNIYLTPTTSGEAAHSHLPAASGGWAGRRRLHHRSVG